MYLSKKEQYAQVVARIFLVASLFICVSLLLYHSFHTKKNESIPFDFNELFNQARESLLAGNHDNAIEQYRCLLQHDPQCAVVHFNLARAYEEKGDCAQHALSNYQKALTLEPHASYADLVHFYSGRVCMKDSRSDEALSYFAKAIEVNSAYAQAYAQRGVIYQQRNWLDNAFEEYTKAAHLNPDFVNALVSLGAAFRDQKSFDKSIACYNQALSIVPDNANVLIYLADALHIQGKVENNNKKVMQAMQTYQKACDCDRNCFEAHHNLGLMLLEQGNSEKALPLFHHALALKPDAAGTHFCVATCYLQQGDFTRGFAEYEWRWKILQEAHQDIPRWDGSDLAGKTLLLHAEQGLGDTFQFIRYARELKKRGAIIIAHVQAPLKPLLSLYPYIDVVVAENESIPACDVRAPLLSLPMLFGTTLATIPETKPYLQADPELITAWQQKLADDTNFKIGICWQVESGHDITGYRSEKQKAIIVNTPKRSIPPEQFISLARMPGVSLYSLQKTHDADQIAALPKNSIKTFGSGYDVTQGSFMDTAALIKNVDLVITVDTAVAHLAGALGVKTWVLLPQVAEWRWLENGNDSPWYPTMRLFRQSKPDDWQGVIKEVEDSLLKVVMQNQKMKI